MAFIDDIMARAKADKKTIVLPESMDKRTFEAAEKILKADMANLIIIGTPEEIADTNSAFWTDGLRHLSPQLKEVVFLRLYKPDASLADIGESLVPPIGKAAVSKRFAKVKSLAEQ